MADVTIKYPEAGQAAFEELDEYLQTFLLSGSYPALAPGFPMKVAASQALQQFQVIGLNSDGALVPASIDTDTPANSVQAIGVCTQAVTGASDGSTTVDVFYSGCFNPDALVWDDSFSTDDLKANAFIGAPTPTTILVRKRG